MEVLWSRFVTKFLYDLREISFYEPFYRFARVGEVEAGDAAAAAVGYVRETDASASDADPEAVPFEGHGPRESVGLPPVETLVERYGSDVVRFGLLSRCGISRRMSFSSSELRGIRRFLRRVRRNISMRVARGKFVSRRVLMEKHRLIRCVTESIRSLQFHKAIAGFRCFVKFLHRSDIQEEEMDRESIQMFLVVLFPFAPKLATELWAEAGNPEPIEEQGWAEASGELLQSEEIEVPIEFNNRVVLRVKATADLDANALRELALGDEKVREKLAGRHIKRVIAVPGRVVNLLLEADS